MRNLELADGLDEVGREQLGHIVETSVEALVEGGQIGVTRVEAIEQLGVEPPAPKPEPQPEPEPEPEPVVLPRRRPTGPASVRLRALVPVQELE